MEREKDNFKMAAKLNDLLYECELALKSIKKTECCYSGKGRLQRESWTAGSSLRQDFFLLSLLFFSIHVYCKYNKLGMI